VSDWSSCLYLVAQSARQLAVLPSRHGNPEGAVGKVAGDAKPTSQGSAELAAGRVQNAVGGLKDAIRKA
jgi:hypothetical protein